MFFPYFVSNIPMLLMIGVAPMAAPDFLRI